MVYDRQHLVYFLKQDEKFMALDTTEKERVVRRLLKKHSKMRAYAVSQSGHSHAPLVRVHQR